MTFVATDNSVINREHYEPQNILFFVWIQYAYLHTIFGHIILV